MPLETVTAFQDHGAVRDTLTEGVDEARELLAALAEAGVDYDDVVETLEREGVEKFSDSLAPGARGHRGEARRARRLTPRDDDARAPTRSTPAYRREHGPDVDAAPRDQPGDHRVGVPHLAGIELVPSPDRGGHLGDELEEALCVRRVVRQPSGTVDCLVHVGDDAATPAPELVAKEAQPAEAAAADRAFGDDAS